MTRDDAVEIVLRGRVFEECKHCEGKGRITPPANVYGKRHNSFGVHTNLSGARTSTPTQCMDCSGNGLITKPQFAEACELLGIPVNAKPPFRLAAWQDIVGFDDKAQEWVSIDD